MSFSEAQSRFDTSGGIKVLSGCNSCAYRLDCSDARVRAPVGWTCPRRALDPGREVVKEGAF